MAGTTFRAPCYEHGVEGQGLSRNRSRRKGVDNCGMAQHNQYCLFVR
jgi:hypothetical protein